MKSLLLTVVLLSPWAVFGQVFFEPLTIHPANIAAEDEFLIAIDDRWPNGCGGDISLMVSAERIEVRAVSASDDSLLCTQAFEPFVELLRPRAEFSGAFADEVVVVYNFTTADGQVDQRAIVTLRFNDLTNATATVETGAWVTDELESSGLFVDQQGDLFSANLADYAQSLGAWFFGAAKVTGDMVIADLSRYSTIVCVTAPCDRATPAVTGTLLAVLKNRNNLLVKYEGILDTDTTVQGALRYRRLDLDQAAKLEGTPDLSGRWIVGIAPNSADGEAGPASSLAEFDFTLISNTPVGGLETITFSARNINRVDTSVEPDFVIDCQDARPVDGELACTTSRLPLDDAECIARFPFDGAGLRRATGTVTCAGLEGDFLMVRR